MQKADAGLVVLRETADHTKATLLIINNFEAGKYPAKDIFHKQKHNSTIRTNLVCCCVLVGGALDMTDEMSLQCPFNPLSFPLITLITQNH